MDSVLQMIHGLCEALQVHLFVSDELIYIFSAAFVKVFDAWTPKFPEIVSKAVKASVESAYDRIKEETPHGLSRLAHTASQLMQLMSRDVKVSETRF